MRLGWQPLGVRLGAMRVACGMLLVLACAGPSPSLGPAPPSLEPPGVVHVVARGETIWRISKAYGVPVARVLEANAIDDVTEVPIGARLLIPGVAAARGGRPRVLAARPPSAPGGAPAPSGVQRQTEVDFAWPLAATEFGSGFGRRGRQRHDGIDLRAPSGTKIRAAESGRVIESRRFGAYGKMIVVKHVGSWSSLYAHNRKNLVKKGEFVEKGQVIAEVGSTGNATGKHVHFEIRRDTEPVDPLRYLPERRALAKSR